MRVAIVGAGASGLQCAHSLLSSKAITPEQLTILEARDRIGGRVHTHEGYDLGAAWVHGTGADWGRRHNNHKNDYYHNNPMMKLLQKTTPVGALADQHHLRCVCNGNPWMRPQSVLHQASQIQLYQNGDPIDPADPVIPASLREHYTRLEQVTKYGNQLYAQGRGLETAHVSLQEALHQEGGPIQHSLTLFYQHLLECWYGAAASELQLCEFIDEQKDEDEEEHRGDGDDDHYQWDATYSPEGDFYGPHCTLQRGMISVLEPLLCDGVQERVRLEEPVIRLSHTENDTILLETQRGSLFEADCCVLTMPAGCLRDALQQGNFFTTPLSLEKQEAIEFLQMGTYKKVMMTFDHIFWPTEPAFLGMVRSLEASERSKNLGPSLLLDNLWASQGKPCIEAVLFGHDGTWATGKSDEVIRDAVLDFMEEAMGKSDLRSHCIDCHITRWEEDPYSRGAYSSMKLGCLLRHAEELRQPEWNGRLIFSGEATISEFEGSVHAALFSGMNAKDTVLRLLEREEGSPPAKVANQPSNSSDPQILSIA
jgi:monoamine oxidase